MKNRKWVRKNVSGQLARNIVPGVYINDVLVIAQINYEFGGLEPGEPKPYQHWLVLDSTTGLLSEIIAATN